MVGPGVTGTPLDWFESYLTWRCQRIKLGDFLSSTADLTLGAPQRSVLGSLFCTFYITPLSNMISGHTILRCIYTDDSWLHVSFASGDSVNQSNFYSANIPGEAMLSGVWSLVRSVSAIPHKSELQSSRRLETRAVASNFALFRSRQRRIHHRSWIL